jgi:RND family efflux transporter MFP subunit
MPQTPDPTPSSNPARMPGITQLELVASTTARRLPHGASDNTHAPRSNGMDDKSNDKSALLNQLRIDRSAEQDEESGGRKWLWMAISVAVLAVGGAVFWFMRPSGVPVTFAVARELTVAGGGPSRGASTLDASGYIVARRQATVSSKITGKVVEVLIEEGQRVAKDQVIARIDDSNTRAILVQAQAQLAQAQANAHAAQVAFDNAKPTFERNKKQIAQGVISAQSFDSAKAAYDASETALAVAQRSVEVARAAVASAQQNQSDTVIRAPYAGVVTVRAAQAGEMVSPVSAGGGFTRTGIGTIVDMDSLELEVDVSENFINRVKPKQPASVKLNAYPDWEIPAEVIAVIPTADRAKATVKVRIGFKVKDPRILPEMGARVSFLEDSAAGNATHAGAVPAVIVPSEAVQTAADRPDTGVVFVVNDDTVERRAVRLGAKTQDGQIVLAGLSAGAKVAIGDLGALADHAKIKIEQ